MTDKEILDAIYNNVGLPKYMKDFIEEEWQKQDELLEEEQKDLYADTTK